MGIFSGIARNLDSHGNDAATHDKQTSQLFPHYNDSGMRRCYDRTDGAEYLWFLQSDPVYRCYNSIHFSRRSSMITSGFLAGMLKAGQSPVFKKPEPKKKKLKTRKAVTAA